MDGRIVLLRTSCWLGALLDGFVAIMMLFPKVLGHIYNLQDFNPGVEFRYAMGLGASLMLGWTVLLLWAERKPIERKGVLLIASFPVLVGLILSEIYAIYNNYILHNEMAATLTIQIALIILFSFTHVYTRDII